MGDGKKELFHAGHNVFVMGRLSRHQLVCEATIRPDVNFLRVKLTLYELRRTPRGCAYLALPVHILFAQKDTEAEIGYFDGAIGAAKDVV